MIAYLWSTTTKSHPLTGYEFEEKRLMRATQSRGSRSPRGSTPAALKKLYLCPYRWTEDYLACPCLAHHNGSILLKCSPFVCSGWPGGSQMAARAPRLAGSTPTPGSRRGIFQIEQRERERTNVSPACSAGGMLGGKGGRDVDKAEASLLVSFREASHEWEGECERLAYCGVYSPTPAHNHRLSGGEDELCVPLSKIDRDTLPRHKQ